MLSFSSIFTDTRNFIGNSIVTIIIALAILSIIAQVMILFFYPSIETLGPIKSLMEQTIQKYGELSAEGLTQVINGLSSQQQSQLVPIAAGYLLKIFLVLLIINLISTSSILSLIYNLSYDRLSLNTFLHHMLKFIPQIILFILLVVPGFMGLLIIATIIPPLAAPLMIVASISYMTVYVIFLSVIIEPNTQHNFMTKVKISLRFLKRETRLIIPMIAIWMLITVLLNMLLGTFASDNFIIDVIFNILSLLLNFTAVCYFYRLYSLTNNVLPYDSGY